MGVSRLGSWARDRAKVITVEEAAHQTNTQVDVAASRAAAAAVRDTFNQMLLANPGLAPHLRTTSGGSEAHGYEPLDQNFGKYMASTGLFAIDSACQEAIATTASSPPLCLKQQGPNDDAPEKITDHPLLTILENPNPEQGFKQWWHEGHLNNGRTGNTFLVAVSDKSPAAPFANPEELWFVNSGRMKPIYSTSVRRGKGTKVVSGYRFVDDDRVYSPAEVLHIKRPNPSDPAVGLSPMKELETTLNLMYRAYQSNNSYLKNGSRPGMVFRQVRGPGTSGGVQGKDGMGRFKDQIAQGSAGVQKAGGDMFLSPYWEVLKEAGDSAQEAAYLDLIRMAREEILAVRGVPPFAIGLLEHANWSNSTEQQAFFYNRTIIPTNRMFLDAMNSHAMVRVWRSMLPEGTRLWLEFDYSGVEALQPNVNEMWERQGKAWDRGALTLNEYRGGIGLDPVDDETGDEFKKVPSAPSFNFGQDGAGLSGAMDMAAARQLAGDAGDNDTRRAIQWAGFEDRKRPIIATYFRRFRPLLQKLWLDVERGMLEAAETGRLAAGDDLPVPSSWIDRPWFELGATLDGWKDESQDVAEVAVRAGGEDAGQMIAQEAVPFDMEAPAVQKILRERTGIGIKGMLDSQQKEIRKAVEMAVRDGDTIGQLTTRIRGIGKGRNRAWAERIARTETTSLYGAGFQQAAEDLGATTKEWLAARGGKRRPMHQNIDGQTVPIGENFEMPDGETGPFPGEISGGGTHNINCACAHNVGEVQ